MLKLTFLYLSITLIISTPIKYHITSHDPEDKVKYDSYKYAVPRVFKKDKVFISSFDPLTNLFSINLTTLDEKTQTLKSNDNLYSEVLQRQPSTNINHPVYLLDIAMNDNYVLAGVPNKENLTLYYIKTNFLIDPTIKFIKYEIPNVYVDEEKAVINSVKILPFFNSPKFLIITSWRKMYSNEFDYYKFIVVDIRNSILQLVKERDYLFNALTYSYDEYVLKTVITKSNKIVSLKHGIRGSLTILTLNEDLLTLYRNDDWLGHLDYFNKLELTHIIGDKALLCYNFKYQPNTRCIFLQIDINGGIDADKIRTELYTDKNILQCEETKEFYLKTLNKNNIAYISRENDKEEYTFRIYEDSADVLVRIPDVDDKLKLKEEGYLNINMDVYENNVYLLNENPEGLELYVVDLKKALDDYYENSVNLVIIIICVCSILSLGFVLKMYKKEKIKNRESSENEKNKNEEELIEI